MPWLYQHGINNLKKNEVFSQIENISQKGRTFTKSAYFSEAMKSRKKKKGDKDTRMVWLGQFLLKTTHDKMITHKDVSIKRK